MPAEAPLSKLRDVFKRARPAAPAAPPPVVDPCAGHYNRYLFKPQPDITAYELTVLLMNLTSYVSEAGGVTVLNPEVHTELDRPIEIMTMDYGIPTANRHFIHQGIVRL